MSRLLSKEEFVALYHSVEHDHPGLISFYRGVDLSKKDEVYARLVEVSRSKDFADLVGGMIENDERDPQSFDIQAWREVDEQMRRAFATFSLSQLQTLQSLFPEIQ